MNIVLDFCREDDASATVSLPQLEHVPGGVGGGGEGAWADV